MGPKEIIATVDQDTDVCTPYVHRSYVCNLELWIHFVVWVLSHPLLSRLLMHISYLCSVFSSSLFFHSIEYIRI
jgi:hypothetical protein